MRSAIVFAALVLLATEAGAQELVEGQVLWGGIKTGMTKAEVKALYPNMDVELSTGCRATISLDYMKKRVSSVKLEHDARSTSTACGTVMLTSLRAKYGEPRSDRNATQFANTSCYGKIACALRDAALIADPDPNTYWQVVSWFTGETFIQLYRDRETDSWNITYYQARRAQPSAADKL